MAKNRLFEKVNAKIVKKMNILASILYICVEICKTYFLTSFFGFYKRCGGVDSFGCAALFL